MSDRRPYDDRPSWTRRATPWTLLALTLTACAPEPPPRRERPSLLLVTLDTTRADAVAPEAEGGRTPALARLAERAVRFTQAYATAPTTLPSHASILTGLYPAGHGLHENGRRLSDSIPLVSERLRALGYATAAFVSGFPLERQFGLARGFDRYDDELGPDGVERSAAETTARALAHLAAAGPGPIFLWVHYYDPHDPYEPPPPFRDRYPHDPYLGEIAAMDDALGRLLEAFEAKAAGSARVLVAGDHGEGRGDHGEMLHGNLLYQGVMRVPLLLAGDGLAPAVRSDPVSVRQIAATLLDWAGEPSPESLTRPQSAPVLGEAMQPFLNYRWQPQVMAVEGRLKAISAGRLELFDVVADPAEENDLAGTVELPRALRRALADYPLPAAETPTAGDLDEEGHRRLASLGYLAGGSAPELRPDAPRPADQTGLFQDLDLGARWFGEGRYEHALLHFQRVLEADPGNPMVAVRVAVARSALGDDRAALEAFAQAQRADPRSLDVQHYLAMHHLTHGRFELAAPLFEEVLRGQPEKHAALRGLAEIREREGRLPEAALLYERAANSARDPGLDWAALGRLRMGAGETAAAIRAFEAARAAQGDGFRHDLELGVLYLAERKFDEAREALDRVPPDHPEAPLALFKRAQVSVLLGEPDAAERVRLAWTRADATTRPLLENERLFRGIAPQ